MRHLQVADSRPEARPDRALEMAEDQAIAEKVGQVLSEAVLALPAVTRQVLLLHTIQQLSGDEVRRIMGFKKRQRVYDELAKAKKKISGFLSKRGIDAKKARQSIGWLDGFSIP